MAQALLTYGVHSRAERVAQWGRTDRCQNGRGSTFLPLSGRGEAWTKAGSLEEVPAAERSRDPLPPRRLWHGEG